MAKHAPAQPPLPPKALMKRVGASKDLEVESRYVQSGQSLKSTLVELLGPEWSWEGRRVLDFGCGSGRLLGYFLDEARLAEFHGSDIDEEMVSWVRKHLCPPIADVRLNREQPPLDYPDDYFDLVTALSVFTHIADGWSDWLLEIRRVLKPGGLLIATFLDSMVARTLIGLPWDEERGGMGAWLRRSGDELAERVSLALVAARALGPRLRDRRAAAWERKARKLTGLGGASGSRGRADARAARA